MSTWWLTALLVPLITAEAPPQPLRYGIERDDCRVTVNLVVPALSDEQRRQVTDACLAHREGFQAGQDLETWIKQRHAALVDDIAKGKAEFPGAASFSGWHEESTIRATWFVGGLLSLHAEHSGFTGGAHGTLEHEVSLLDLNTRKRLTLDDLIARGDQALFAKILTASWKLSQRLRPEARPSEHGLFVDELPAALPLITPAGIEVIYSPYEVGPWSTGTVRVVLTRDEARPFLRRDPWGK